MDTEKSNSIGRHETADENVNTNSGVGPVQNASTTMLVNISRNMAQMTTLLEKMCQNQQPTETVRPPGGKRKTKRDKSQSPTGSDSDSGEEYASSINKRQRSRDNDNVSLYASDSLDGDDLKALTERNKVTDQKGRESKSQNPVLQNLAESFEDDDATGEKIDTDLANIAIKRWAKKLNPEKVKGFGGKYKRPENCKDLKAVKVNKEIWSQLSAKQRKTDLQLANMQQLTRKIAFANLQTTNWLLSQPPGTDTKQPLTESVDAIAMLGHLNTQLSKFHREQIRSAVKPEYKAICSAEIPADSQHLFGDDLAKQLTDASEASKISRNVTHTCNYPQN